MDCISVVTQLLDVVLDRQSTSLVQATPLHQPPYPSLIQQARMPKKQQRVPRSQPLVANSTRQPFRNVNRPVHGTPQHRTPIAYNRQQLQSMQPPPPVRHVAHTKNNATARAPTSGENFDTRSTFVKRCILISNAFQYEEPSASIDAHAIGNATKQWQFEWPLIGGPVSSTAAPSKCDDTSSRILCNRDTVDQFPSITVDNGLCSHVSSIATTTLHHSIDAEFLSTLTTGQCCLCDSAGNALSSTPHHAVTSRTHRSTTNDALRQCGAYSKSFVSGSPDTSFAFANATTASIRTADTHCHATADSSIAHP
jgi:hypothetical protein